MDAMALVLVICGAINWGAIGIFGVDIIGGMAGGSDSVAGRVIYSLIGMAGVWAITLLFKENERNYD